MSPPANPASGPRVAAWRIPLLLAWGGVLAVAAGRAAVASWREAFPVFLAGPWRPHAGILAANLGSHLAVVAAAVVMLAALWQTGRAGIAWLAARGLARDLRAAAVLPLGAGAAAAALAGLLFVRLWFGWLVVAVPFGLAAIAMAGGGANRLAPAFARARGRLADPPLAAAVAGLCLFLPWMLLPETHDDAWSYFLAAPDRWLKAHGLAVQGAYTHCHFPLLAEMLYAPALALGLDQVPKWLNLGVFLSGALGLLTRVGPGRAGWGLLFAVPVASGFVLTTGKDEGFIAGWGMLAGACALAGADRGRPSRGALRVSAICAGLALATKITALPVLAWVPAAMCLEGGVAAFARLPGWGAVVVLACAPFFLRPWLVTGDPFYPLSPAVAPFLPWTIPGWDDRHLAVWRSWFYGGPFTLARLGRIAVELPREQAAAVWVLPACLLAAGRGRRIALAALGAYLLTCLTTDNPLVFRIAFPALAPAVLAAGVAAPEMWAGSRVLRIAGLGLLVIAGVHRVGLQGTGATSCWNPDPFPYLAGAVDRAAHVRRGLTAIADTEDFLARRPRGRRILVAGEIRTYRMPVECLIAEDPTGGSVPILWELGEESATERDWRKRMRQLGADRLIYNSIRAQGGAAGIAPFAWNDRGLALWRRAFGRWMELERIPAQVEARHGGLYIYRLRRSPAAPAPAFLMHLPGTEGLTAPALRDPDPRRALAESLALTGRMPGIGQFMTVAAFFARISGRADLAWRLGREPFEAGEVEDENVLGFGLASFATGRLDDASAAFGKLVAVYPDQRRIGEDYLARVGFRLALRLLPRDPPAATRLAQAGLDRLRATGLVRELAPIVELLEEIVSCGGGPGLARTVLPRLRETERELVQAAAWQGR